MPWLETAARHPDGVLRPYLGPEHGGNPPTTPPRGTWGSRPHYPHTPYQPPALAPRGGCSLLGQGPRTKSHPPVRASLGAGSPTLSKMPKRFCPRREDKTRRLYRTEPISKRRMTPERFTKPRTSPRSPTGLILAGRGWALARGKSTRYFFDFDSFFRGSHFCDCEFRFRDAIARGPLFAGPFLFACCSGVL